MTRQHSRSCSKRTLKCTPSTHTYTKSRSDRSRRMNARCSSCHCVVSRVITDGDSPAADPKNSVSAGAKSPVDMPCRYSSGSTSDTFGLLRHHGATIELRNRIRSPLSGSTRRSFTRGARISTAPAAVVIVRGRACPLRTTSRRPCSSSSPRSAARYSSTSSSNAAASIRRAPSRQISSNVDDSSSPVDSSVTTVNIGVPSSPALQRQRLLVKVNEEGTSRPRTDRSIHNFRSYLLGGGTCSMSRAGGGASLQTTTRIDALCSSAASKPKRSQSAGPYWREAPSPSPSEP